MNNNHYANFFNEPFYLDNNSLDHLPPQPVTELEGALFNHDELLQNRATDLPSTLQNYGISNFEMAALQTVPENAFSSLFRPDFMVNAPATQQSLASVMQRPVTPPDNLPPTVYVATIPQSISELMAYSAQRPIAPSNSPGVCFSGTASSGGSSSGDAKNHPPQEIVIDPYADIKKATLNLHVPLLQSFQNGHYLDKCIDGRFRLKFTSYQVHPGESFNGFSDDNTPTPWLRNLYGSLDPCTPVIPIEPIVNNTERRILYVGFEFYNGTGHKSKKSKKGEKIDPRSIGQVAVSCMYWERHNDWFITSTDFIELIEVCLMMHFCREERNRIRRNLQCFDPITLTKNLEKADADPAFFSRVMGYDEPTTNKIEKDIKVFRWSTLVAGMNKVINSFVASSTTCSRPPDPWPIKNKGI